jgi:hypothetical protein
MRAPLLAAALLTSLALSQANVRLARGPDVLLITLDTTRADRMGFLGSTRGLTPALDALARSGTVFTRAYAQAPITTVSHATILTGTYPPLHGVDDFGAPLPAFVPYLPDLLRRGGYRTAAFVGSIVLDPRSGTATTALDQVTWERRTSVINNTDGSIVFKMDGAEIAHYGRFVTLDRGRLIRQTWVSELTRGLESLITIRLEAQGGKTLVTLVHSNVPDDDGGRRHQTAWGYVLGTMMKRFSK